MDEKVFENTYNQYIYIYKSRDLMRESMMFYHVVHSMKRIELSLSHIRDKNKFKSRDSLFPSVQCFKTIFVSLLFNVLRLLFVLFGSTFQDFLSLTHTQNSMHFHSPFSLLLLYIHMSLTVLMLKSDIVGFVKFMIHLESLGV